MTEERWLNSEDAAELYWALLIHRALTGRMRSRIAAAICRTSSARSLCDPHQFELVIKMFDENANSGNSVQAPELHSCIIGCVAWPKLQAHESYQLATVIRESLDNPFEGVVA